MLSAAVNRSLSNYNFKPSGQKNFPPSLGHGDLSLILRCHIFVYFFICFYLSMHAMFIFVPCLVLVKRIALVNEIYKFLLLLKLCTFILTLICVNVMIKSKVKGGQKTDDEHFQ